MRDSPGRQNCIRNEGPVYSGKRGMRKHVLERRAQSEMDKGPPEQGFRCEEEGILVTR